MSGCEVDKWKGKESAREGLGLLGRDGGVAGDELGHDSTGSLDSGRERGDVEEEEVLGLLGRVSGKDGGLDGGSVGDGLVGVDRLVGLLQASSKSQRPASQRRHEADD